MIAGTITDQDIARRLIDYADELGARARAMEGAGPPMAEMLDDR